MSVLDSLPKDKQTSISPVMEFWTKKENLSGENKSSNSSPLVTKEQAASAEHSDFV